MVAVVVLALALASAEAEPLTLADALSQAKVASPLRAAAEQIAAGSAQAAAASGRPLNPLVELRTENFLVNGPPPLPLDIFAVASQTIELWGKRGLRVGAALAERDMASASLRFVDRQIVGRTVQLYLQALRERGSLETLQAQAEGFETMIATLRRRVEEGTAAEADLLRLRAEAARLTIDLARTRVALERSLSALTFTIGATQPLAAGQLVEPELPVANLQTVVDAQALARHPEVEMAAARVTRAQQTSAFERIRSRPDPMITAGYKRTGGFDTGVGGVTFTVPLFERNRSGAARAAGEERAAMAEHDAVVRRLTREASTAIAVAAALADRVKVVEAELVAPADAVRAAALSLFREGTADIIKLIDAERLYQEARRTARDVRLEAATAAIEARLALGEEPLP